VRGTSTFADLDFRAELGLSHRDEHFQNNADDFTIEVRNPEASEIPIHDNHPRSTAGNHDPAATFEAEETKEKPIFRVSAAL
jgi:hypothetical protein